MSKYSKVFKSYDIRGILGNPIDTDFSYSMGKSLGKHFLKEYGPENEFLLAADGREGNTDLMIAFIAGLQDAGCDSWILANTVAASKGEQVHPLGVCSTAFFYRALYKNYHLGVIFTASHNPPERVGMKIANSNAALLPSHELEDMIDEYEEFPYKDDQSYKETILTVIEKSLMSPNDMIVKKWKEYVELLAEYFPEDLSYTIVVDYSGGGATGYEQAFFQLLQEQTNLKLIELNTAIDSTFSAHLSDTNQEINYQQVIDAVKTHDADFGIMFDGDGDRLGVVDEKGKMVQGDMLLPVISTSILQDHPGATIIHDITCSNNVPEAIKKAGGTPIASKVGYRNVKKLMLDEDAKFGGELSGHLLFPETGHAESPLLALGHIMKVLKNYQSFSRMILKYTDWIKKPVTNYTVDNKEKVLGQIEKQYNEHTITTLDGVRVDGEDWWLLVRPSSTEPKLRTYIEAKSKEKIDELTQELEEIIGSKPIG